MKSRNEAGCAVAAAVLSGMAKRLLSVKISAERLSAALEACGAEGTYRGVDVYEAVDGIRGGASAALSYILDSGMEAEMRKAMEVEDEG